METLKLIFWTLKEVQGAHIYKSPNSLFTNKNAALLIGTTSGLSSTGSC